MMISFSRARLFAAHLLVGAGAALASAPAARAEAAPAGEHRGAAIFKNLCVECHGPDGQGVDGHDPLYGDRPLDSLTRRIERTMPEDEEDKCVGEDAAAVADYIYQAFYSPAARAKLQPPARDLVRLTVPQFRQSVADLVASSLRGSSEKLTHERGIEVQFSGRHPTETEKRRDEERKRRVRFDRVAEGIALRLPEDVAGSELDLGEEIEVEWEGSIVAEETGPYEFVLRTPNGARLWVNETDDDNPALIDDWVASGNEVREASASVYLVGGRAYPVELRFFKAKNEKAGSLELLWKPPHGVLGPVPTRHLVPQRFPRAMVVSTAFPPDDASFGFERGNAVSREWVDAVTRAAVETGDFVTTHLNELADTQSDAGDRADKVRAFCVRFAETAFRRPLDEDEKASVVGQRFEGADSLEQAAKRVVLHVLSSPRFLYPDPGGGSGPDGFTVAARLALALWDSVPDGPLMAAAREGRLSGREGVLAEARRMIDDGRTRAKLRGFFHQWLEMERAENVSKDPELYPEFDEALFADLRTSLHLFLDDVVWGENPDYRRLLLADSLYLNGRLGGLYGKGEDVGPGFQKVSFDGASRSGVITHPFLLTAFSYHNNTSPIHRGVFLTRNIVGRMLKPPPEAIEFDSHDFDPTLTMREKVTELTRAKACMACHATINPLGFSLEHYDAIGRWRTTDNEKPVDARSDFTGDDGETVAFAGARDVAEFAAESRPAQRAFVRHLFHHMVKQGMAGYGLDTGEQLHTAFAESGFNIRELILSIATVAALADHPAARDEGKGAVAQHQVPSQPR